MRSKYKQTNKKSMDYTWTQ